MEAFLRSVLEYPMQLVVPIGIFAATLAVGLGVRAVLRRLMRSWFLRTKSRPARVLSDAAHGPFMIWFLVLAIYLAVQSSELPVQYPRLEHWVSRTLMVLTVLSLTVTFSRLAGSLVRMYGAEIPTAVPVTTLTQTLAQLAVVILGIVVLLNQLGIPITPILTALGVGGLAVALALQDTLSNLFAGFYMGIAGQIRLGDYIKLNSGEEGYISDITWRSTSIRSLGNNLIIVPNNKLAQAIVTNFHLPEKRMSMQVQVAVAHEADVEQVEQVLNDEVRKGAREIPGMLVEPEPRVNFDPGVTESAIVFTVNCHVAEFVDQFAVRNELRKRLFRRLRDEGVQMPYPGRTFLVTGCEDVVKPDRGVAHLSD